MRMERMVALLAMTLWLGGCGMLEGPDNFDPEISLEPDPNQKIATLQAENEQLRQQVATLSEMPESIRNTPLYNLKAVKLGNYSGFYDKDDDDSKESLIVYVKPIDDDGDVIKAIGQVEVELWDLNDGPDEALLGQWSLEPAELKEQWYASFGQLNYRLVSKVANEIEGRSGPFTVKVTFADVAYGKVFHDQAVIELK